MATVPEQPMSDHGLALLNARLSGNRKRLGEARMAARADGYYDIHPGHDEIQQPDSPGTSARLTIVPEPTRASKSSMGLANLIISCFVLIVLLFAASEAVRWLMQF